MDLKKAQAARLNTIRDINRQIVLNYVREREPISRAEISRETALQRSTISTIVEGLKGEGLIEEIGEGESTGGRRPTLLRLRMAGPIAIGVAIRPSRTIIATSNLAGRVLEQEELPTHQDPEKAMQAVIRAVKNLSDRHRSSIEAVGVSIPGLADPAAGQVLFVPYFQWPVVHFEQRISSATGLPV